MNGLFVIWGRIEYFLCDLHAADCVYHQTCSVNFRTNKRLPTAFNMLQDDDTSGKVGRPVNNEQYVAFLKTRLFFRAMTTR